MSQRLLIIGLDGYEASIADTLISRGKMPHLERLQTQSARLQLDHGAFKRTGLAWQHFSTGQAPDKSGIWSAVNFDPKSYNARQLAGAPIPFLEQAGSRAVVIDAPYFDLRKTENVRGFVNWGAHDPGVEAFSRPAHLLEEIGYRFGDYPAQEDIYGFVWPDAARTADAASRLTRSLDLRTDITAWMLSDKMPDWDVALTVVSELHSAIEPFWHGFDETHPLHDLPSGAVAREGLESIYIALDRMIGRMTELYPDAAILLFSMHGMGANDADAPSMILFPEFMYRLQFGKPLFQAPAHWAHARNGVPLLATNERWESSIFQILKRHRPLGSRIMRKAGRVGQALGRVMSGQPTDEDARAEFGLDWMPSSYYRPHWPQMRAFALPSYYDGRIRLNVAGREARGMVDPVEYEAECARIERELLQLTDPRTGEAVVEEIMRTSPGDPSGVPDSDGDIVVIWRGDALGFNHPNMSGIGPVPYRRTGGHTGGHGEFMLRGDNINAGEHGIASAFDVAPTIEDWLGVDTPASLSGQSVMSRFKVSADA